MEFEGAVTLDDSSHYLTVHLVAEPAAPVEGAAEMVQRAAEVDEAVTSTPSRVVQEV